MPTDASIRWAYYNGPSQRVNIKLGCHRHIERIPSKKPPVYCEAIGCLEITTGEKPYCLAHIQLMPYVQSLDADLLISKGKKTSSK